MSKTILEEATLRYLLNNDNNKVSTILAFRNYLSPHGFEVYTKYFFDKVFNFKTTLNGATYEYDNGIDIKGIKIGKDKEKIFLCVQCKKHKNIIKRVNISSFYGEVAEIQINFPSTLIYYITTSDFSKGARMFAEEKGISIKNYQDIIKMNDLYSLDEFKTDVIQDKKYNIARVFNPSQLSLTNIEEEKKSILLCTKKDLYNFLRMVRQEIAKEQDIKEYEVCTNDTLNKIAIIRPHNLDFLKSMLYKEDISYREQEKINKYGERFIKALKLI